LANSWSGSKYEEIIIDEAQDLPEIQIGDWDRGFIDYIKRYSEIISYGADDKQIVYPERSTNENRLNQIFPENVKHTLTQNFRNTYEILLFAQSFLKFEITKNTLDRLQLDNKHGNKPVLKIAPNKEKQNEVIFDIIKDYNDGVNNIAILVPFAKMVDEFELLFVLKKYKFSRYRHEKDPFRTIENIHITTFKSAKGLEFDVVIIPEFGSYQRFIDNYKVVKEEDYYVAFTRAKRNLFLISEIDLSISKETLTRENINNSNQINKINLIDDSPF